ncbi:MAG: MotA/TolQ/ExbB proton channel family protein [Elusimicrobiota bacterium]
MNQFTIKELITAGGPVLIFLTALSVYSLAVIIERWKALKKATKTFKELAHKINFHLKNEDTLALSDFLQKSKNYQSEIFFKILKHEGANSEKREFSEKLVEWYSGKLSKRLNALATIGSSSPFIGLFGTVVGVIRAFKDLSSFQSAGPSVVAAGIAEALVNTAAGLFVAVPAIVAYNFFISRINALSSDMNLTCENIIAYSQKKQKIEA